MTRPRCVLLGIICCVAVATAYDTGLHVYLGTTPAAESLWADFDPSFYGALQLPDTNEEGFLTRKFYCIVAFRGHNTYLLRFRAVFGAGPGLRGIRGRCSFLSRDARNSLSPSGRPVLR